MLLRGVLAALLWGCALVTPALGQTQTAFVFEESLRFTFPVPASPTETVSFWVFSKEKDISQVTVRVKEIKDPDGLTRDFKAVEASLESEQVTLDGTRVTLKLNPTLLGRPGEYRVLLLFAGTGPAQEKVAATVTPVIVHPAADINLEEVKGQTFEVWRWTPFNTAAETFRLPLSETTGKAELKALRWLDQGIFFKDTKKRVPGSVTVTPVPANAAAGGIASVGDTAEFDVKVAGLERAGSFEANLVVNAPGFSGRKVIPILLNVSDAPLCPLFVIFLGVLGGFTTNYVASRWRPGQLNRLSILRLKGELSRWRALVREPVKAERVENMWLRLRTAEEANEISDTAQIKTQLDALETDLDTFRKEAAVAKDAAQKALAKVRNETDAYVQQFDPLDPDEQGDLLALRDRLTDVERLIGQEQVDYAQEKIAAASALYNNLLKRRLTKYLAKLTAEFNELKKGTTGNDQQASLTLFTEVRALLDQNKLDEASAKLAELKTALEDLATKQQGPAFARGGPAPLALDDVPRPAQPLQRTSINIITAPKERTTDVAIRFEIVDPEQLLRAGDKYRWTFGEPGAQREDGQAVSYQYREYGDYEVKAEVLPNDPARGQLIFTAPLAILPGRAAQERAGIRARIKDVDLILSAIALVLASLTGLLVFYVGKPFFGSLSDYLLALLWGFGIDQSVRGFAGVLGKIAPSQEAT